MVAEKGEGGPGIVRGKGEERTGSIQPRTPPRPHIRFMAPVKPSERLAAIVVFTTSKG